MTSVAATARVPHAHHDDRSFIRKSIFSTDHKIIGIQFLFVSLFFLLLGGVLAMQMRWQLGFPGKPMPGGGLLPESMAAGGVILPEYYVQLVSMHGTFMVFFAIMPLLVGVYANFLIPLKIGTHDMAFPRINMASFWAAFAAGLLMFASLFVPEGGIRSGWTNYAPLSARPDLSGVTIGQLLWCVSIVVLGLSSVMGSVNYITTIINHRAPGMTWFRMPLSVWALFITAILAVLALPVLQGAAILLLFDQTIGTHFFDPAAGGGQGVQLDGDDVARQPAVPRADAQRHGLRGDVRDRRAVGDLHGRHAGGHVHPRHLLHRRTLALRAVRRQPVRPVRRDPVLVPEDVRPDDERAVGQGALLAHLRLLQPHLLPDAHPRERRPHAADLRSDAVRLPQAVPADERVHLDQRVPVVRDTAHLLRELLVQLVQRGKGAAEPVGGQRARVVAAVARPARQLGEGADRVPRAVRVQLARGLGPRLPAAE